MIETTRLLRDLVALPSINPMGRDLQGPDIFEYRVTDYLENFFRSLGVRYERQTVAPRRDNIVAFYEPPGQERRDSRGPSGHGPGGQYDHRPFRRAHRRRPFVRPRSVRRQRGHGGNARRVRPAGA